MIKLEADVEDEVVETVELFAIGDKSYTVPAKPRVNVGLRYLRNVRKIGVALSESALLEDLLGDEGYDALCNYRGLKPEHLRTISEAAARLALGALEDTEGNGDGEPTKSAG